MTQNDFRILCTALGFTAVIVKDGELKKDNELRVITIARLIESFCKIHIPECFELPADGEPCPDAGKKFATAERMATAIAGIMKEHGGCLPQDLIAKGFTPEEVERHWPMAKALAHVELKIMDA